MVITFDPVLVSSGGLAVRPFGLLALVGLVVAIGLSYRAVAQAGLQGRWLLDAAAWGIPVGIVCGRLVAVVGWWDYYVGHAAEITQLGVGGLSLAGALWGGGLVASARLRTRTRRAGGGACRRRLLDAVVPFALLGVAIGQMGAFLEGAGQGRPSDLPWATHYASPLAAAPDIGVARHPAQLYTVIAALVLFRLLNALPSRWPAGTRTGAFMVLGGAAWAALGLVRLEPAFLFGVQIDQMLAALAVVTGVVYLARVAVEERRARAPRQQHGAARDDRGGQDAAEEGSMAA